MLCVDDGQLLDDASATLLHQLVAGEAFAVVDRARRTTRHPDAVRALWKDELCRLLELRELSFERQREVCSIAILGATVDGRSVRALWDLTLGNVLFLRELVSSTA